MIFEQIALSNLLWLHDKRNMGKKEKKAKTDETIWPFSWWEKRKFRKAVTKDFWSDLSFQWCITEIDIKLHEVSFFQLYANKHEVSAEIMWTIRKKKWGWANTTEGETLLRTAQYSYIIHDTWNTTTLM